MLLSERFLGCLLGGACGDALGAPVEFMSTGDIAAHYGSRGIVDLDMAYGVRGAITDDTQMTIFTVEGLIRACVREAVRGIPADWPAVVHHSYLRWYATQSSLYGAAAQDVVLDGWVVGDQRLWHQRAPGATCLSALATAREFGRHADNASKGCGTVMRDAPWGLMFHDDPSRAYVLAGEAARTTHGHPSAAHASGALAAIIARIASGLSIADATERTIADHRHDPDAAEVCRALDLALQLSVRTDWRSARLLLGLGWVAEEALSMAVLCAIAAPEPRSALIAAVNHDGDSDSTGAICGNLVGTAGGVAALPQEWAQQVELGDMLHTLARDLLCCAERPFDAEQLSERYPGW